MGTLHERHWPEVVVTGMNIIYIMNCLAKANYVVYATSGTAASSVTFIVYPVMIVYPG